MKKTRLLISWVLCSALVVGLFEVRAARAKTVGPPDVAWKDMTAEQKKAFMKTTIVPTMKPMFQEFDKKAFKTFNCISCHGKDGAERKYKMPSNDIKPLPGTPEAFQAKMKAEADWPKWVEFMKKVSPEMAKLLGLPAFDPKAPDPNAFGCKNCHKIEGSKT